MKVWEDLLCLSPFHIGMAMSLIVSMDVRNGSWIRIISLWNQAKYDGLTTIHNLQLMLVPTQLLISWTCMHMGLNVYVGNHIATLDLSEAIRMKSNFSWQCVHYTKNQRYVRRWFDLPSKVSYCDKPLHEWNMWPTYNFKMNYSISL